MPLVGFLPAEDPRVQGTVDAIERELMEDGLRAALLAGPRAAQRVDGLPGREGAFLACSFWLADNYALMGRTEEAQALFERLLALRNDVGLLSEEYDVPAARASWATSPRPSATWASSTPPSTSRSPSPAPRTRAVAAEAAASRRSSRACPHRRAPHPELAAAGRGARAARLRRAGAGAHARGGGVRHGPGDRLGGLRLGAARGAPAGAGPRVAGPGAGGAPGQRARARRPGGGHRAAPGPGALRATARWASGTCAATASTPSAASRRGHGFASERFAPAPGVRREGGVAAAGQRGVLLEPASVVAKAWEHIERIGAARAGAPSGCW